MKVFLFVMQTMMMTVLHRCREKDFVDVQCTPYLWHGQLTPRIVSMCRKCGRERA